MYVGIQLIIIKSFKSAGKSILDNFTLLVIILVLSAAGAACAWSYMSGSRRLLADKWQQDLKELEVRVRMGSGEQLIDDLRALAQLYIKSGRPWDAEQTLRRACHISQQNWGQRNPLLIPVMEDLTIMLDKLHRTKEADNVRKEIEVIKQHNG